MGWGICFGLEDNKIVCLDGCKWSRALTTIPPSGYKQVLKYYERDAHRELDMIRDECPGTSSALKEACSEHFDYALGTYERQSTETKKRWHDEFIERMKNEPDEDKKKKLLKKESKFFE